MHLFGKLATLLLAGTLVFSVACGGDSDGDSAPNLASPDQTGSELSDRFLTLLQTSDIDGLRDFLSDAFILQRANGAFVLKAEYLENPAELGEYTISDVTARQAGDTLVVRWSLAVEEVIDGRPYKTEPAPRLSTFVYEDGEWRMASHANFNAPN